MQALDAGAGLADAIGQNDPDQLGQSSRAVSGASDRGGERGNHAGERVALAAPLRVDGREGFALDLGADRPVGRVLPPGAEEPRVGLPAGLGAGRDHLRA